MKLLEPQNDRVLIKPIEEDEQMYGNIVIPDMGKERPEMGQVIAVGPGR
jgi:chaperonin GroES